MEFVPVIALATLVKDFVNFLKYLSNRDGNALLTQLTVWVGGVLAVVIAAKTTFASGIPIGDKNLDVLNFWDQLFVGLLISGLATTVYKAVNGGLTGKASSEQRNLKLVPGSADNTAP